MRTSKVTTVKGHVCRILESMPDDATYEEIIREVAFARMLERGLQDMRAGRTIDDEAMGILIRQWQN